MSQPHACRNCFDSLWSATFCLKSISNICCIFHRGRNQQVLRFHPNNDFGRKYDICKFKSLFKWNDLIIYPCSFERLLRDCPSSIPPPEHHRKSQISRSLVCPLITFQLSNCFENLFRARQWYWRALSKISKCSDQWNVCHGRTMFCEIWVEGGFQEVVLWLTLSCQLHCQRSDPWWSWMFADRMRTLINQSLALIQATI